MGRLNGITLNCRHIELTKEIKNSLIDTLPKMRVLGSAFEEATNSSFIDMISTKSSCPTKLELKADIVKSIQKMKILFESNISKNDLLQNNSKEEPIKKDSKIGGNFMLQDHNRRFFTDKDMVGKFQLIYFGYTFCPDVCPTSLITISSALNSIGDLATEIRPYFITVDPSRDTPEVLKEYVAYFYPSMIGLTGTQEMTDRVATIYNIKYEKVEDPSRDADQYIIDHSSGVFLMSPEGQFITKFAHGIAPKKMAAELRYYLELD
ncbi:MAG: SCO family protein [Thiotrichales bacterium]|nr:SCO family protein [Thiotrichales bacterium]MBT3613561.1 SCO family protein [Thiotrichales bacterium]MBT4573612.1 SCO family protein [Thiotrichales bacterium]